MCLGRGVKENGLMAEMLAAQHDNNPKPNGTHTTAREVFYSGGKRTIA